MLPRNPRSSRTEKSSRLGSRRDQAPVGKRLAPSERVGCAESSGLGEIRVFTAYSRLGAARALQLQIDLWLARSPPQAAWQLLVAVGRVWTKHVVGRPADPWRPECSASFSLSDLQRSWREDLPVSQGMTSASLWAAGVHFAEFPKGVVDGCRGKMASVGVGSGGGARR